jgi:carboxymethylenebutenolidase
MERERLTTKDFDPELWAIFDDYVHGHIDRRAFLDRAAKFAVGGVTAVMLLDMLNPKFAEAQQVQPGDARLRTEYVDIESPKGNGKIRAYVCTPAKSTGKLPGVLVVHENRGLNPHIEDIARRLALDNFVAVAPDALTTLGGYPGNEDQARELFPKLDQPKVREDFIAATHYLRTRPDCTGRIGAVGFCYGGAMVGFLATRVPELAASVPFYGGQPSAEDTKNIKAAILAHYAGPDPVSTIHVARIGLPSASTPNRSTAA